MTTPILETAGWTLIHFLWQGCALAGVAALLLRLAERRSANARYVIACATLVVMVAAPAVTARLLWSAGVEQRVTAAGLEDARLKSRAPETTVARSTRLSTAEALAKAVQPTGSARSRVPVQTSDAGSVRFPVLDKERIVTGLAFAWMLGVALLLARMAGGWWRVRTLHRAALATTASGWQSACRRLSQRLRLSAAVHVVESIAVEVPTVIGWMRPVILLPVAAVAALTPAQVEAILAHELAHIRRHDYAVNLLQTIAETLLFYHPAVWWVSKRIRAEREHCCDDVAVRVCGDAVSYAHALAELESWRVTSTAMAVAATGGSLLARVRRILREPLTDESRSKSGAATLVLTLVFTAGAGAVQQLPSWIGLQTDARVAAIDVSRPTHVADPRVRLGRRPRLVLQKGSSFDKLRTGMGGPLWAPARRISISRRGHPNHPNHRLRPSHRNRLSLRSSRNRRLRQSRRSHPNRRSHRNRRGPRERRGLRHQRHQRRPHRQRHRLRRRHPRLRRARHARRLRRLRHRRLRRRRPLHPHRPRRPRRRDRARSRCRRTTASGGCSGATARRMSTFG
jgi:beta-lactamase regulating signal transducer with metallopeptidase domain